MGSETTPRDRVWSALFEVGSSRQRFRARHIEWEIEREDRPSGETVRRVLRAATEQGILKHSPGSPWFELRFRVREGQT